MDLNTELLLILAALLMLTVSSAAVIARTAKSKGYRYGLFFVLGIVSYLLTSVVTVFMRPKGDTTAKPRISSVALLILGIVVEFIGIGNIPDAAITSSSDTAAIQALLSDSQFVGGAAIAFAGILIVIGSVANDYRHSGKEEIRQL
jgi:hypothetical protein